MCRILYILSFVRPLQMLYCCLTIYVCDIVWSNLFLLEIVEGLPYFKDIEVYFAVVFLILVFCSYLGHSSLIIVIVIHTFLARTCKECVYELSRVGDIFLCQKLTHFEPQPISDNAPSAPFHFKSYRYPLHQLKNHFIAPILWPISPRILWN